MKAKGEKEISIEGAPENLNLRKIIDVLVLKDKELNWDALKSNVNENILYHTPNAKGIDIILKQSDNIFLIQITTRKTKLKEKYTNYEKSVIEFAKTANKAVVGWFISFSPMEVAKKENNSAKFFMSSADSLKKLLGNEIYEKLEETKNLIL